MHLCKMQNAAMRVTSDKPRSSGLIRCKVIAFHQVSLSIQGAYFQEDLTGRFPSPDCDFISLNGNGEVLLRHPKPTASAGNYAKSWAERLWWPSQKASLISDLLSRRSSKSEVGWEQIFYGEFDGRRRKRVLVKIIGE